VEYWTLPEGDFNMFSGHETIGYDKNCNPNWWFNFLSSFGPLGP